MKNIQPRIYTIKIVFDQAKEWEIADLARRLDITPERADRIEEDGWGIRNSLEIWFQEIGKNHIVIHIQKKHYTHDRKYCQQLEEFFSDLEQIDFIESVIELG